MNTTGLSRSLTFRPTHTEKKFHLFSKILHQIFDKLFSKRSCNLIGRQMHFLFDVLLNERLRKFTLLSLPPTASRQTYFLTDLFFNKLCNFQEYYLFLGKANTYNLIASDI